MTNPNLAYVQLLIDRSGSMQALRPTVVAGINDFLAGQRKQPGSCHVSLCWFGNSVDHVYHNKPLAEVQDLVMGDYVPSGGTPLYEAMCTSIDQLGAQLAALSEDQRPGLVTVLVITDGEENSSRPEFTADEVKRRVEMQTGAYHWNFQYLCANQDVMLSAGKLGISMSNAAAYCATVSNTQAVFAAAGAATNRGRDAVLRGCSAGAAAASMTYTSAEVQSLVDPIPSP